MILGIKQWETRSWKPRREYLGQWIALHAAKSIDREYMAYPEVQKALGETPVLRGAILAVGLIYEVKRADDISCAIQHNESLWGDFSSGRYGWHIKFVTPLPEPISAKGMLSLWNVLPEHIEPCLATIKQACTANAIPAPLF